MRRAAGDSQSRRHAVCHAKARVGERHAREQGGVADRRPIGRPAVGPELRIFAWGRVLEQSGQRVQCPRERLEHQAPRQRLREPADERFDQLCDAVESGGGDRGHIARSRQVGIDDRHAWHHHRAPHALLESSPWAGNHCVSRGFGAGAGRGGHRDHRQRPVPNREAAADALQMINDEGVEMRLQVGPRAQVCRHVRRHGGDRLGQIDGRPTAHGHHHYAITILVGQSGQAVGDVRHRRLAIARGDQPRVDPGRGQAGVDPLPCPGGSEAAASAHDPRPPAPEPDHLADLIDPAGAKPDQRRRGEIVGGESVVHGPWHAGIIACSQS